MKLQRCILNTPLNSMHIGKTYKFTETVKKGFSHSKFFNFENFWLFIIINTWINHNLILDTFMNVICVNRKACTSASWHVNTTPTSFVVGLSNNNNSTYQEKLCVKLNIPTRLTTERMWQVNRTVNITFRTIHLACTHCTYTQM